jgi:hypothetical protein
VASSCSSAAGAGEQRRAGSFGSGSWASFSPTKADAGHTAACAAVAGAGSFWSSFGEEMPSEASGPSGVSTGKQQQGTQPPPSQMHHHDAPKQTAVQAGGAGAANSALLQRYQPSAPVRPPLAVEAAEVSPLSVGLSRMTVGQAQGPGQAASREVPPTNAHPPSSAGKPLCLLLVQPALKPVLFLQCVLGGPLLPQAANSWRRTLRTGSRRCVSIARCWSSCWR